MAQGVFIFQKIFNERINKKTTSNISRKSMERKIITVQRGNMRKGTETDKPHGERSKKAL